MVEQLSVLVWTDRHDPGATRGREFPAVGSRGEGGESEAGTIPEPRDSWGS